MATFIYRCPSTGYKVQGFIADSPAKDGSQAKDSEGTFRSLTCLVCTRIHLVNPTTGKVIGD